MSQTPEAPARRRGFLRAIGLGTAAAAAASGAEAQRADSVPSGQARKENEAGRLAARYRETDDVRAYYRTNRYEG